jgi:hypothetical protein
LGAAELGKRTFCLLFSAPAKKSAAVKAEHNVEITNSVKRECAKTLKNNAIKPAASGFGARNIHQVKKIYLPL